MRNRAKCKLCEDIIESKHRHDYVSCICGEISVDGGQDLQRCRANNFENFPIVDDGDNLIEPKGWEKEECKINLPKPARQEKLKILDEMIKSIENLPPQALYAPISHADFRALLLCLSSIMCEE